MKKILITGVSGFVGQALSARLSDNYEIIGIDVDDSGSSYCSTFYNADITKQEDIDKIIKANIPQVIVHAAAIKSLRQCESDKEKAYKTNTLATIYLNRFARVISAKFIFISSDQVFKGDSKRYDTTSRKDPINYYGLTKSIAEDEIAKDDNAAICRTALVFGEIPYNQMGVFTELRGRDKLGVQGFIVEHVRYKLARGETIQLPSDEYCNPTSAELLAKQIRIVIEKGLHGAFHCCGGERISRYEFGVRIAKKFGLDEKLIDPRPSNDPLRPKDVSLSVQSTERALGFRFPGIDEMLSSIDIEKKAL